MWSQATSAASSGGAPAGRLRLTLGTPAADVAKAARNTTVD